MKKFIALIFFESKMFFRNTVNIIFLLFFPSLMLLIFGGIFGNEPTELFNGFGTVDVSVPAYMAMVLAVTGIMNLPLTICEYRERHILRRLKATPLNPVHIIFAQLIVNFIMTIVGMILLMVVGRIFFQLHFMGNIFFTSCFFLISLFSIFSIGLLIGSITPNIKACTGIANIIFFPMLFLSGASLPLEMMPPIMIKISKILPLTYVVEGMKKMWLGQAWSTVVSNAIILLVIVVFCTSISIKFFRWE